MKVKPSFDISLDEKLELLNYDNKQFYQILKNELSRELFYSVNDDEFSKINKAIDKAIEIEFECVESGDYSNQRASFYTKSGHIIIIKQKRINIKMLWDITTEIPGLMSGNGITITISVIKILLSIFFEELNDDVSTVYLYLCNEYYKNGHKFKNTEIHQKISEYIYSTFETRWSNSKIDEILKKLDDISVIEFINGYCVVNDFIYFQSS